MYNKTSSLIVHISGSQIVVKENVFYNNFKYTLTVLQSNTLIVNTYYSSNFTCNLMVHRSYQGVLPDVFTGNRVDLKWILKTLF